MRMWLAAVAIVASMSGTATVRSGDAAPQPVKLFDWVADGTTIEVAKGGSVTLAFANGTRYELSEGARATLGANGFTSITGKKRDLTAVPPLPNVAAIASTGEQTRPAAFRVRGAKITGLYPHAGASALANETTLRFDAVPQAARYKVEIEDEAGSTLLEVETDTPSVVVSPGVLAAGQHYYWRVRTLDSGVSARGESDFTTLSAEHAASRNALRKAAIADASSLPLLAEIDRRLGLLYEANQELREAAAKAPNDAALQAAVASQAPQ